MVKPLVIHIAGARPNFPKLAPVMRALNAYRLEQLLVHTGQHYDPRMSEVFFTQLGLPEPDLNLGVGSGSHASQTGEVMRGLERLFTERQPAMVIVYGDVNSTLAAALVAAKQQLPLAHVEAGLRSFDRAMPEEINRLVTDRLSTLLLTTSPEANTHLGNEGVDPERVHFVGNPMIDTLLANRDQFLSPAIASGIELDDPYVVATLHRPSNVDHRDDVAELVTALHACAELATLVIPLHPRGRARLQEAGLDQHRQITLIDPLGYLEFMGLVNRAIAVVTDSGGVQEETTMLGVSCFTLRANTERPVTISHGTNQLISRSELPAAVQRAITRGKLTSWPTPPLWDGHAGVRIAAVVASQLGVSAS